MQCLLEAKPIPIDYVFNLSTIFKQNLPEKSTFVPFNDNKKTNKLGEEVTKIQYFPNGLHICDEQNRNTFALSTCIHIKLLQCKQYQFSLVHPKSRYIIRVHFANTIFLFVTLFVHRCGCVTVPSLNSLTVL